MSHDVDDDLRRLFAESADTIDALPPGFDAAVIGAGTKRRRNRRATAGAGAVAIALVAIAAVWQGPSQFDRSTPPANGDETPTKMTTDAWVASLPRGDDLQAAYVDGVSLHVGDIEVTVTGDEIKPSSQIELLGRVSNGWLASVVNYENVPADSTYTIGVVAPDGTYIALIQQPNDFLLAAISPDGTMFAAGRQVRSAVTGEVLQTIPDGLSALMWIDSGLVLYRVEDAEVVDSTSLWDPSDPNVPPTDVVVPERDGEESGGAMTPTGLVAIDHAGCTELYDFGLMTGEPDVHFCEGSVFELSDSGSVALLRPWTAYDISSGAKASLPVPTLIGEFEDFDAQTSSSFFWEDNDKMVFGLEVGVGRATVYVRCFISAQHCERATDKLTDFRQPLELARVE